ncbi:MAG: hypothetical protein ACXWUD_13660 [Methylosarcina sp.]
MPRKLYQAPALAWLLSIGSALPGTSALADPPPADEVLRALGMNQARIGELAQGRPVAHALNERSADELAAVIAVYLPVPLARVAQHLRRDNPDLLDVDVIAHGLLSEQSGAASLAPVFLPEEETEALLNAEPGDEFNLSGEEIDSFKTLKKTLKRKSPKALENAVLQRYREILFRRFEAYRRGGTPAIAPYARGHEPDSKPSLELRQAANAIALVARYFPALHQTWLNYPKPLPPDASEAFPWVEKKVENRPAAILRHRISMDWHGGILVLTREFYAAHSYNSSQWVTGCLPYRGGTVVFQQVYSYTDQVAGLASNVKHIVGRELLKDKMLKSFERLCSLLNQCH